MDNETANKKIGEALELLKSAGFASIVIMTGITKGERLSCNMGFSGDLNDIINLLLNGSASSISQLGRGTPGLMENIMEDVNRRFLELMALAMGGDSDKPC